MSLLTEQVDQTVELLRTDPDGWDRWAGNDDWLIHTTGRRIWIGSGRGGLSIESNGVRLGGFATPFFSRFTPWRRKLWRAIHDWAFRTPEELATRSQHGGGR